MDKRISWRQQTRQARCTYDRRDGRVTAREDDIIEDDVLSKCMDTMESVVHISL